MRQLKISQSITNRGNKSIEAYLQEVSKLPMITPEEEVILAKNIRAGDMESLEKLVNCNLRFVVSVAKQYQHMGLTLEDLISEGNIGLIKAARRFDETKGFKFISYAVWWIRQSIIQAMQENARMVRLPVNKIALVKQINRIFIDFAHENQREPTIEEIAVLSDLPEKEVAYLLNYNQKPVSTDAPINDQEDSTLIQVLEDKEASMPHDKPISESLHLELKRSIAHVLTEREAEIIVQSFGIGMKEPNGIDEISKSLNLSKERVRQLRNAALRKLQSRNRENPLLKSFL